LTNIFRRDHNIRRLGHYAGQLRRRFSAGRAIVVSDISAAVPTKSAEQLDLQALHRVRSGLIRHRTAVINQIRALLLERGISVRQGYQHLRAALPDILGRESERLSPRMVRMSSGLSGDWRQLDQRHEAVTDEIEALAKADEACQGWIGSAGVTTHLP
jgi:transposase